MFGCGPSAGVAAKAQTAGSSAATAKAKIAVASRLFMCTYLGLSVFGDASATASPQTYPARARGSGCVAQPVDEKAGTVGTRQKRAHLPFLHRFSSTSLLCASVSSFLKLNLNDLSIL